tara:strand:+ start:282 stop:5471 length:5190 start_codon:yes stop_codon:yes gene_type:complete
MAQISTTFVKGKMNKTVDERLIPQGEYIDALNVRLGSTEATEIGAVENSKGNTLLTDVSFAGDTLSGAARTIGVYEDGVNETLYWFINDPSNPNSPVTGKVDLIVSYNTDTSTLIYHVISTSVLNFDKEFLITGVDKIKDLLFFTDDLNPPRVINVAKSPPGYAQPVGGVDTILNEEDISVILRPPGYEDFDTTLLPAQVAPLGSPSVFPITADSNPGDENYMETRFLTFAYRYRYADGGYSAISLFSTPVFQPKAFRFSIQNYLNSGMFNRFNACDITFSTGTRQVLEIDLLYKQTTSNVIYVIKRFNKAEENFSDNDFGTYRFDNSEIYTTLGSDELLRLYDNVPLLAKAQTIQGNRLVYGNYVDQYNIRATEDGQKLKIIYDTQPLYEDIQGISLASTSNPSISSLPYTIGVGSNGINSVCTWELSQANDPAGIIAGTTFNFLFTLEQSSIGPAANVGTFNQQSPFSISMTFTCPVLYPDVAAMCASPEFRDRVGGSLAQGFPTGSAGIMQTLYPCNNSDQGGTLTDKFYADAVTPMTGTNLVLINGGRDAADSCTPAVFPAICNTVPLYSGITSCGPAPNTIPCLAGDLTDDSGVDFTTLGLTLGDLVVDTNTGAVAIISAINVASLTIFDQNAAIPAVVSLELTGIPYQIFSQAAGTPSCTPKGFEFTSDASTPDGFSIAVPATEYYYDDGAGSVIRGYIYYGFIGYATTAGFLKTAEQGSLHSNRDYETGVVYMDGEGRSSTVLVSTTNTSYFPPLSSVYKNKIQVSLRNLPPYWAKHYKFVVKPSEGSYQTIFSNIFYSQDGSGKDQAGFINSNDPSLVWFKLDGNNQNLVKVGDELIVKVDTAGAVLTEERATVLAITAFSQKGITSKSLAGLYMLLKPSGWTIESTQQNYFRGTKSKDADNTGSFTDGCINNYNLNDDAASPVPYTIPAGSSIRIKIRNWRGGGGGDCDSKSLSYDKSFVSTADYPNMHAWAVGDDLQSQMTCTQASTCSEMDISFNPALQTGSGCFGTAFFAKCSIRVKASGEMFFVNSCGIPRCWEWFEYYNGHCATLIEVTRGGSLLVWETVPLDADPNLFYDASDLLEISTDPITGARNHMGARSFSAGTNTYSIANGSQDQVFPAIPMVTELNAYNCYTFGNGVESFRINDSPAGKTFNLGERTLAVSNQDFKEADRFAGMTYSGVYSDSANSNNLNEFNLGLANYKDLETSFGPIQILHSRETDILVLQEDRISYVLSSKNVITDSTGGGAIASVPQVLGTQVARIEEFGISFNPESFAVWGEEMFFTDTKRGAVLNLRGASKGSDQLQIVSRFGMNSWFRDRFNATLTSQKLGAYDPYMNEYVLTINNESIPRPKQKLPCGSTISQLGNSGTLEYDVDLGLVTGDINVPYIVTSGSITINITWNGVVYSSGVLTPSSTSTFSFVKTTNTPQIAAVQIVASAVSTYDVTVECAPEIPLTIIQVVYNSINYAGQTIHTNYNWTDGTTISNFSGISPATLIGLQASEYVVNTGVRGIGNYPSTTSDITLRTEKINPDNFTFDPTNHKLKILSSNTLYNNTTADIASLLATSSLVGGGVYTNPSAGINQATELAFNMPVGNQYLYLIWEFSIIGTQFVCYCSTNAVDVCCDCDVDCKEILVGPPTANLSQVCSTNTNDPGSNGLVGFNGNGSLPVTGNIVFATPDCKDAQYLDPGFYIVSQTSPATLPKKWVQIAAFGEVIDSGVCP